MLRRSFLLVLAFALLPGLVHAQPVAAPATDLETVQQHLRTRVEAHRRGLDALRAAGAVVAAPDSVLQFYEQRQFAPAWTDRTGPTAALDSLMAALRRADRHGLQPTDYHLEALATLRREHRSRRGSEPGRLADLELLSTDAFLLYASHLLTGRVTPTTLTPTWNVPARQTDLLPILSEAVRTGGVAEALRALHPPHPEYARLRDALRRYRRLAAAGGWPTVPEGPTLRTGDTGAPVDSLRRRLRRTDDLTEAPTAAPESFDSTLHDAVVRFQERHGLEPDGAVGPATRAALNVPAAERVQQLRANLERWRWLPRTLGTRHVLVNIAGHRLRVVEDGATVMEMRVITGQPFRQTPVFSGEISYLVFNPYWHVPHSIATEDKLPEIKKDPGYLARQQFEVFRGWGADAKPIAPSTIDWSRLSADNFPYRLRQKPGPLNALGQVKFMFPNPHSVYLHDTPTRGLFARAERSFSSGCIRVEHPVDLAESLLADRDEWSAERIRSIMGKASTEQTVSLREKVPVHLQYWTAWAGDDGMVHFRPDVYERDAPLQRALNEARKYPDSRRDAP